MYERNKIPKEKRSTIKILASEITGRKKIRRNLRENETLDNAVTIEINTEKNILITSVNTSENTVRRTNTTTGHTQWNKLHPDNQMTLEQYIEYRNDKEAKKEQDK